MSVVRLDKTSSAVLNAASVSPILDEVLAGQFRQAWVEGVQVHRNALVHGAERLLVAAFVEQVPGDAPQRVGEDFAVVFAPTCSGAPCRLRGTQL